MIGRTILQIVLTNLKIYNKFLYLGFFILLLPLIAFTAPPTGAVKFIILETEDSTVGTPTTITIEAQKTDSLVDTNYQQDVTLVASGSVTGDGLVDIVDGVGIIDINDLVEEMVYLSLSDTESTGLDVDSTEEVEFLPIGGGAIWNQNSFWFRDDDGTEITATGFGSSDVRNNKNIISVYENTEIRLRFSVKVTEAGGSFSPRLEFKRGSDCGPGVWRAVGQNQGDFILRQSPNFEDGDSTTRLISTGNLQNFVPGKIFDLTNPASLLELEKSQYTEYEWSIFVFEDEISFASDYVFRVTNDGQPLTYYTKCPVLTTRTPSAPTTPSGGISPTTISISGRAYPGAQIFLVEIGTRGYELKKKEIEVSDEGDFEIKDIGILSDFYTYSLVVKDKSGRQTQTKVYNVDLTGISSSLVVKDIFIPPTIDIVRSVVSRGDFIKVIGNTSPLVKVNIELDEDIIYETESNDKGDYQILINTAKLSTGRHNIRAKQEDLDTKKESGFSLIKNFLVSDSVVPKVDFNIDGKITITDLSIFLSLWRQQEDKADLNEDGKINISDLSIFLRAVKI